MSLSYPQQFYWIVSVTENISAILDEFPNGIGSGHWSKTLTQLFKWTLVEQNVSDSVLYF